MVEGKPGTETFDDKIKMPRIRTVLSRILKICFPLTVEPVLFLSFFFIGAFLTTNVTLFMEWVCSVGNYSDEVCNNFMTDDKYWQQKVTLQKSANNWVIVNTAVITLPTVALVLFAGPWSDQYSRKITILIPMIGPAISSGLIAIMCYLDYKFPPYALVVANIPMGLTGLFITLQTAFSYMADITSIENRTIKYMFAENLSGVGLPIGRLVAGYIYKVYGVGPIYILAFTSQAVSFIYALIFLKETRGLDNQDHWVVKVKYFFNLKTAKESFRAIIQKRPGNDRVLLICTLFCMPCAILCAGGLSNIYYLYTQLLFGWTQWSSSVFQSTVDFTSLLTSILIAPIITAIFKMSDTSLGILAAVSCIISAITMGIVQSEVLFYTGGLIGLFKSLLSPLIRSSMTKIVGKNEIGTVLALVSSFEIATPVLGNIAYGQIYNHTVGTFPSCCFYLSGFIVIWPLLTFMSFELFKSPKTEDNLHILDSENEDPQTT